MKTILITVMLLCSVIITGQEIQQPDIKTRIYTAIEANFPIRFNAYDDLKDIFYGRCDQYPKYCRKLKFGKITDFRIIALQGQSNPEIEATLNFTYYVDDVIHYDTAILKSAIQKVANVYEIDYIQIIGVKGIHEYYRNVIDEKMYILNRLAYQE